MMVRTSKWIISSRIGSTIHVSTRTHKIDTTLEELKRLFSWFGSDRNVVHLASFKRMSCRCAICIFNGLVSVFGLAVQTVLKREFLLVRAQLSNLTTASQDTHTHTLYRSHIQSQQLNAHICAYASNT